MTLTRRSLLSRTATGAALATLAGPVSVLARQDDKPTIGIGSKNYTEQIIMGETLALLLENSGYEANRRLNLGGSLIAHEALVNGDIDTYVEYTGTGLIAILGEELPEKTDSATPDTASATPETTGIADQVYDRVAEGYLEEFDVKWLKPWGFNNTNTVTVRGEMAEELGLKTISDLAPYAEDMIFGSDQEFPVRPDGLPGLQETYGFEFKKAVAGDVGLMYNALAEGEVDAINAYSTDGRIPSLNLVILEDDLEFFPPYYAAPIVRQDTLDANADLEEVLNQPAGLIDDQMMASINALVDEDDMEPEAAAQELLEKLGIL